jgi:hypothetical protein
MADALDLKAEETLAPLTFGPEMIYVNNPWKYMLRQLAPFRGTKL